MVYPEPCKEKEGGRSYLCLGVSLTNLHLPGFEHVAQVLKDQALMHECSLQRDESVQLRGREASVHPGEVFPTCDMGRMMQTTSLPDVFIRGFQRNCWRFQRLVHPMRLASCVGLGKSIVAFTDPEHSLPLACQAKGLLWLVARGCWRDFCFA